MIETVEAPMVSMHIGGDWVGSIDERTFESVSPATGEVLARLPQGTKRDAQAAIQAALPGAPAGVVTVRAQAPARSR